MGGEILTQRRRDAECAKGSWKLVRLGELCSKIGSGATPSGGKNAYREDGISLIRSQNVLDFSFSTNGLAFINEEQARKLDGVTVKPKDVLLNITGDSVARVCIVPDSVLPARVNQHVCILRPREKVLDSGFLAATLISIKQQLLLMAGSGATRNALTKGDISELKISLPPLPTQCKIAAVLGALDDKIENNRKICANLEAQAQAIFKSWFVDFEPFGGKMPQGWKMGKISSVFQLARDSVKAGERPDLPYLPIDMLPMHSFFVNSYLPNEDAQSSLILFKKWDVLIGAMRVYFHRVLPAPCDGITRTTCFVLRAIKDCYREFGLMAINQDEAITFAQQTSKGSTMPYAVWEGGLADYETVIPDEKAAENFSRLLRNLIEEEQSLAKESRVLAATRDALLPKLMSGEIDVEKVKVA